MGTTKWKGSEGCIVVLTKRAELEETTNEFMDGNYCTIKIKHSLNVVAVERGQVNGEAERVKA